MNTAISRAERLLHIETLIKGHPGIRCSELSKRLGVHRSTIGRDIDDISVLYPLTEDDKGGLSFIDCSSLDSITFSTYEAVYVYLACKLITDTLDRHSPYAASAIRKLGTSLQKVSPSLHDVMVHDADKLDGNRQIIDKTFLSALEGLTRAWIKHKLVRLKYNSQNHKEIRVNDVGIIRILPNRLGGTFVVLTYQKQEKKLRLFRIDRIESISPLNQEFEVPDDLEVEKKLSEAWSIWFKEGNPVPVKLKFSSRAAGRVKESQWHASQKITDCSDGGLIVDFEISEPEEMYPWIRGWGIDVEILEPEYLRQRFIEEIKKMTEKYGI